MSEFFIMTLDLMIGLDAEPMGLAESLTIPLAIT
jgi:hypothetical protein